MICPSADLTALYAARFPLGQLRAWVILAVYLAKPLPGYVRVNLRRADTGVAEQFLNHPQIRAVLQHQGPGGFGLGVERTVAWICGLDHVRETIPFPRLLGRMIP